MADVRQCAHITNTQTHDCKQQAQRGLRMSDSSLIGRSNKTNTCWEPRNKNRARKAVERKLLRNSRAVLDVFRSVEDDYRVRTVQVPCGTDKLFTRCNYAVLGTIQQTKNQSMEDFVFKDTHTHTCAGTKR